MKIVWSEQARQECAAQYRFYFGRNPDAAIMDGIQRLRHSQKIGRPGRVEGSRELVISGVPFLIVYDENPARVEILPFYDRRQDWQNTPL